MDEFNNNNSNYEPNFIMSDPEPGEFRDPRENFRTGSSGSSSGSYSGSYSDSYYRNYSDNEGQSASWDNHNGLGKVTRKKKARKPSPPVTLTRRSLALIIVLCMSVSALFGIGGSAFAAGLLDNGGSSDGGSVNTKTAGYTLEDAAGSNMTVKEITEAAKDSVVEITTESVTSDSWMQQYVTQGA